MLNANDLKLNQNVKVKLSDDTEKDGIIKGINEESGTGKVRVKVEYLTPVRNDFDLENVIVQGGCLTR
ncbi:hypothetical protein [Clostridium algidicarnis]|uniref:hypothetical protein n=1 Tax=Clostridium algidicarnis TaxID=37659 RepID=UPI001C0C298D|nr:hypothetical protein [Clostridium algidicarnis]MBU3193474.1 hypothetical protein [Clostridium algidicarnis]